MTEQDKEANELKLLLVDWKLEKLYEMFLDEDIFIEELEMMTEEHLDAILKNCKMGVRIRFEHHFKKWRLAKGKPLGVLDAAAVEQCAKCCATANNNVLKKEVDKKAIATTDQETQTAAYLKTTQSASTQTTSKSTFVKVQHGAEQLREVLNKINKNNVSYQLSTKPKLAVTSESACEQPTTTTFHDVAAPTTPLPCLLLKSATEQIIKRTIPAQLSANFLPITPVNLKQPTTTKTVTIVQPKSPTVQIPKPVKPFVNPITPDTTAAKPMPIIPKASLKRHSVDDKCATVAKQRLNSNTNVLRKYFSKGLQQQAKSANTEAGKSLVDILLAKGTQGYQLLQQYHRHKVFTAEERELLLQIICEFYLKHKLAFNIEVSDKITDDILVLFPSEQLENYDKGVNGKICKLFFDIKPQFVHSSEVVTLSDSSDTELLTEK